LVWGDQKIFKNANARLDAFTKSQFNHNPDLDSNSIQLAGYRSGAVEDRLLQTGIDYSENLEKRKKSENDKMFTPAINQKSRDMASGLNSD
jgi:hypothetical protein